MLDAVFTTFSWSFGLSTSVRQSLLSSQTPVSLGGCSKGFAGRYPGSRSVWHRRGRRCHPAELQAHLCLVCSWKGGAMLVCSCWSGPQAQSLSADPILVWELLWFYSTFLKRSVSLKGLKNLPFLKSYYDNYFNSTVMERFPGWVVCFLLS